MNTKYLAQLNIGRLRYPPGDRRLDEFFGNLDRVNAIAERSPGFVWRLKDESGNATGITPFSDPEIIPNLSVWESAVDLEQFVWRTIHKRFYSKRRNWFAEHNEAHLVMWWIDKDCRPTPQEAWDRLVHLRTHGPSDHAFGWESLADIQQRKAAQCA